MRIRVATFRSNCFAATFVAAIACAEVDVHGDEAPLTPLTPAVATTANEAPVEKPSDRYVAAAELYRASKWNAAATAFEHFLSEHADDARAEQARFFLGECLLRDDKPAEAAEAFRLVLKTAAEPATIAAAQFRCGEALFQAGKHAEAVTALETFVDAQPKHAATARGWYYLAEATFALGRFEQAEHAAAHFTAVYADESTAPRVALLQAAALVQLGRNQEARAVLTPLEAEAGERRNPAFDVLDGSLDAADIDAALAHGELDAAQSQIKRFLKVHAAHELAPYVAFRSAEISFAEGKWNEAAERFAAVLVRKELNAELRPSAWLGRVQALAQDRNWDEVLTVAAEAREKLSTWPRRYEFDYLRGRAHLAKAEMNEARTAFGRVLSSNDAVGTETAALAQYMTAETHFLQRHYDTALADYRRAAEHKYPYWQAAAQLQAGKCCEQLHRPEEARAAYDVVLTDFAESAFAAEARTRREACLRQASAPAAPQRK